MSENGYYRSPTIAGDTVVFVSEDDLWTVPAAGGVARRLTSGLGEASSPFLSPDGRWLAFVGREEGHPEVYCMEAGGGTPARRTYLGASLCRVAGWSRDSREILFATNAAQPFSNLFKIAAIGAVTGFPRELPFGQARYACFGRPYGVVIGRHGGDPARWKRYRGGLAGRLWIDAEGDGVFERLIELDGNLSHPMWVGNRVYFHSDHEGIGNLYSCTPFGKDLRRHTRHADHYVRNPSTDGRRIVYHAGADLFLFDPRADSSRRIDVRLLSPRTQRSRRFVSASRYLEDYALSRPGQHMAVVTRGKVFSMANWEGGAFQHGAPHGARYRLARWLADGKRIAAVTDETGEESIVLFTADAGAPPRHLGKLDIGRPIEMLASPTQPQIAIANHRYEILVVDLAARRVRRIDRSRHSRIAGIAWSPDGKWLAYGFQETPHQAVLRLAAAAGGKPRNVTRAVLQDVNPAFDPEGKYLYFLSYREFNPVYDQMQFELGFPRGMRPYLVMLRKDLPSPFSPPAPDLKKKPPRKKKNGSSRPVRIDFDGIIDRVIPFPVPEGRYAQIMGIPGGAVFSSFPLVGTLDAQHGGTPTRGLLEAYRFEDAKRETLVEGIHSFDLSGDAKSLIYRAGDRLRVIKTSEKPDDKTEGDPPSRRSGWIDLSRLRVSVDPAAEWGQMFHETWRLMRDHFWTEDMSGVDWGLVRRRYRPLVARVATRSEFSDLVWEMQGELGTSHCYETGGDYRPEPRYEIGKLAADFTYDRKAKGYRIVRIVRGDTWDARTSSPLAAPGVDVREGDVIVALNGRRLGPDLPLGSALVNQAGREVTLTLARGHDVTVRTLRSEYPPRYRAWVNANRARVHRETKGEVGYIHIPDMGPHGFSEFHRQYLAEVDRPGLIVDVRWNGGGHVSQLLLEKLARKRVGYDVNRWGEPVPYPGDSPAGPMVAITNEQAGSDGDIFSHCFKLYKLGPLVGRRTWGGVIGIHPRHALVDESVTTQPEFSFWFSDVGYGVENYGTDPDIDVDIAPQDDAAGRDPQLDRTIAVIRELLRRNPPRLPAFAPKPDLSLPDFPRRR